eukprot:429552_1
MKIPKKKYKQSIYKSNYRNNEQNRNDGCYKCGSTDHDRKDCPRKRTFCKICAELEDVTKRERRMYTHNTEAHDDKMPTRNTGFERYSRDTKNERHSRDTKKPTNKEALMMKFAQFVDEMD